MAGARGTLPGSLGSVLAAPGGASAHPGVCKRGACAVQEQSGTSGARHMGTGTVAVPWGCRERPGCPALKNGQPCRATLGPRGGLGVWAAGHSWGPSASRSSGVCACMCVCARVLMGVAGAGVVGPILSSCPLDVCSYAVPSVPAPALPVPPAGRGASLAPDGLRCPILCPPSTPHFLLGLEAPAVGAGRRGRGVPAS